MGNLRRGTRCHRLIKIKSEKGELNRSKTIRRLALHEREELFTRFLLGTEAAEHTRSCSDSSGLLNATHGHA